MKRSKNEEATEKKATEWRGHRRKGNGLPELTFCFRSGLMAKICIRSIIK
jgi:hypothetical protein